MLFKSWIARLFSDERRRSKRLTPAPPLVAFYWDGGTPKPRDVRDISATGLYLLTESRWYPGTVVTLSLQEAGPSAADSEHAIAVGGQVVRAGEDGVGFAFVVGERQESNEAGSMQGVAADRKSLGEFVEQLRPKKGDGDKGQALIEYALMLPLIILLLINVVNFGGFFFAWITVSNAARAGGDYAIMGGASAGAPGAPTSAQINAVVVKDISSLPNNGSLVLNICQNNNGTNTNLQGSCAAPTDPEAPSYVLTLVDVTYTYVPYFAAFQMPGLGIYTTIPPTTIHRQAFMRSMQ